MLYEPERQEFELTDVCYASQMNEILEKVVTHGTGRRARGELYVDLSELATAEAANNTKIRVPAFARPAPPMTIQRPILLWLFAVSFRRSSFRPIDHSMAIASYVGYDLNETMRRGPIGLVARRVLYRSGRFLKL